ncbi:MAG: extensin family protein [Pseudomonadota bacterium]
MRVSFAALSFAAVLLNGCGQSTSTPDVVTRGALCGDASIQGIVVGDVPGRGACGISNAVEVDAVAGVFLSQPSLMNCSTAKTLESWVRNDAVPTIGKTGGGLKNMKVVAHYACRTRNNQRGAKLSEHAKGNAIDIAAFRLNDGSEISVLRDWNNSRRGQILKKLHKTACGPFGTVLGPKDRFHKDHFHFDTAKHRGGAFCR